MMSNCDHLALSSKPGIPFAGQVLWSPGNRKGKFKVGLTSYHHSAKPELVLEPARTGADLVKSLRAKGLAVRLSESEYDFLLNPTALAGATVQNVSFYLVENGQGIPSTCDAHPDAVVSAEFDVDPGVTELRVRVLNFSRIKYVTQDQDEDC